MEFDPQEDSQCVLSVNGIPTDYAILYGLAPSPQDAPKESQPGSSQNEPSTCDTKTAKASKKDVNEEVEQPRTKKLKERLPI